MTVTVNELSAAMLDALAVARLFVELLVIVSCGAVLTLTEMIRGRPAMWSAPATAALLPLGAALGLASIVSIAGRFVELLR